MKPTGKSRLFPAALFNRRAAALLATGALLLSGNSASATTYWTLGGTTTTATSGGGTGNWEIPGNWSNGVPDTGPQNAFINNGGTVLIGPGGATTYSSNDLNTGGTDAGGVTGGSGTYTMTGATTTLTVHGWMRLGIGTNSTGVFNMNAGTLAVTGGNVHIGEGNGTNFANAAQLNISGGTFNNGTGHISIGGGNGGAGTGIFNLSSTGTPGTVVNSTGELWVGDGVGSTGVMNMSGGTVNLSNFLAIGRQSGTGTINLSGGTINKTGGGNVEIGTFNAGSGASNGTLNISGTGAVSVTSGNSLFGNGGPAAVNISGGSYTDTSGFVSIGDTTAATVTVTGGSFVSSVPINVGDNSGSNGTLNVSGTGLVSVTSNLNVGKTAGDVGTVNLGDGTVYNGTTVTPIIAASKVVGGAGNGTFNFNGGVLQDTAGNTTANNAAFFGGTAVTRTNVRNGGAFIDANGNTVTVSQPLLHSNIVGDNATDGGLTIADSTGTGTLILTGANTYTGTTNINAGTVSPTTASSFGTTGNVTFGGGTLLYTTNTADYSGRIKNSMGAVSLNTNGLNETLASAIDSSNTGGLTKTGTGTLTLSAADTYTGPTTITTGNLTLDHSGTNTGSLGNTAVNVNANTLLVKGSTTIGSPGTGSLTVGTGGTVSLQDNSINTLGIGSTLTLGGSNLNFDLGTASGSNDAINVGGAVTNSGSTINLDALGSIVSGSSTYTLITAASGLGSGFTLGTKPAGFNTYSLTSSTSTAEILNITATPTVVGAEYWTGAASRNNGDTANNFGFGATLATPASNYSTDRAGTIDPKQVPGATTDLIFTANNATPSTGTPGILTTQLDGAYTIHSLTFDVPAVTTITSTVINTNGNPLTIGAGGLTVASTSNSSGTINGTGSVILNGNQAFADNNALGLTVSTPITGNAASGTNTLSFNGTGSGPVALSGVISDGILGGNLGLIVNKTGGGVLTLSGANTYTGGTTLNNGQVVLGSATALGAATNTLTFGSGSTSDLQLGGNSITVGGLNTNPTVGTPVIENASATAATLTDNVVSGTANYGGVLQDGAGGGALALTETGGGVQTLSGANTYTGGTTVNATGGLALGAGGTLGAATGNTTVTAGTLDLGGQSVTQNELILNGGFVVGPTGTLTLSSTGTAVLISGGAYTFAGTPADTANLLLNGGNIVKTLGGTSGNAGTGTPVIAGNITLGSAGSTVALQDSPGDPAAELSLTGVISGPGALTQDNTVSGSTQEYGTLLLSGANTYTGGTNITVGRTEIANSSALGTGAVTVGTRGTLALGGGAFQNVNGGNLTIANNLTLNHTVSGNYGIDAIQNNFGANTLTGTISLLAPTNAFTINGGSLNQTNVISGTGALNKYSGSPLILSGANTYSGGTNLIGGTVNVNSAETPGVSGPLGSGGTITFSGGTGGTLQYSANNNFDYSSRFATTAGQTFNIDTNGQNVTYATPLTSTGTSALNKYGTGTLDLTAAGSAVATSTIHAGAVTVDTAASLVNTGLATVGSVAGDNGTLNVSGQFSAGTISVANATTSVGTVNQTGGIVNQTGGADFRIGGYNSAADAAAVGTYNLSGGTLTSPANFQVGGYGHGTLIQTGGTVNSGAYTDSGRFAGGVGLIDVEGGNFNQTNVGTHLIDGEQGTGVITVGTVGTITSAGGLVIGQTATGNGTFNLNTGGTLTTPFITGGATVGVTTIGTAVFNFNGGTLQDAASNTVANNAAFLQGQTTANVRNGGAVINTNGNTATIGQALLHSTISGDNATDGGLTKTGAGTLILTGADTYTGATTITGGTLQVGNATTGTIASTSAVNVGGATTLTVDNNAALNNTATAVSLGDANGSATVQNAFSGTPVTDGSGNVTTGNVQQAGALSLGTGTQDILNFGGNTGTFDFNSAAAVGGSNGFGGDTGTGLNIQGFGAASNEMLGASPAGTEVGNYQLLFNTALTPTQLADISFLNSDSSQFGAIEQQITSGVNNGKFQVLEGAVAAPEPAQTGALGLFGLGLGALILKARKRRGVSA